MEIDGIAAFSSGAKFYRSDLHIHSFGGSHDVRDSTATPQEIVREAQRQDLSLIAIADHNEISNVAAAIEEGRKCGVFVIPAVELSTPEGHLLCYAPTADALESFFHSISIVDRKTSDCRCNTGMIECLSAIQKVGGFGVIAHIESDGAFESNLPAWKPSKFDIICHPALLGFEVKTAACPILYSDRDTDSDRRAAAKRRIEKLGLGSAQYLARILNSDAHTIKAVGRNARNDSKITRYKMESPSFDGLRIALQENETRVRLEEEIPKTIPIVQGVTFEGGFLDGQAIHFSQNLTCIIGGRGSGKSTAFEAVRLIGGEEADEDSGSVVDSDVWPDAVGLFYRDETDAAHVLSRTKGGTVENADDPIFGSTTFTIESYRQGETNILSKQVQNDPLALLTFIDKMANVERLIELEDSARTEIINIWPEIIKAKNTVAKIPDAEKDLTLKRSKVERLKKERGEDFIKLQQQLENEKRTRLSITQKLGELQRVTGHDAIKMVTGQIKDFLTDGEVTLAEKESTQILGETSTYENSVDGVSANLRSSTEGYIKNVRAQIDLWTEKEAETQRSIETKRQALLASGIRLDMPFISKLIADEASAAERVRVLKTWPPHLQSLQKNHRELIAKRWDARAAVARQRAAFAAKANGALKESVTDLLVTLKYDEGRLCPEAERIISEQMGWRTLQQLKSKSLVGQVGIQGLLACMAKNDTATIKNLKDEAGKAVFAQGEVDSLFERLGEDGVRAQLEAVAVHDVPRLTVARRVSDPAGNKYAVREFRRLSLGQQQSVILALLLTSNSTSPLIIDQPEDNLDSEFIYKTLVPVIRRAKERRQVIVVTHNANIAVLGDAEQIVVLKATHNRGEITCRGSIDDVETRSHACSVLEGTREAFERRADIYGIKR